MRFALVTLGSAGDLRPYLAIGAELVRRGHVVHLLGQSPYAEAVEQEGVNFLPIAGQREHDRTLNHPDLWHPIRGLGVLWRHLFVPAVEPTYAQLEALTSLGHDRLTVLAHPLAVGARFFRENHAIRLLTAYTAPTSIRSTCDPMFLGSWRVPPIFPDFLRRGLWRLLDAWKLDPMCRPRMDQWQRHWHTPRLRGSIFGSWLHSPDGGIAMFPQSFQAPCSDWPPNIQQFGFPALVSASAAKLSPALKRFLESGPAPLVIYPGSASSGRHRLAFNLLLAEARTQGARTIMVDPRSNEISEAQTSAAAASELSLKWTNLPALLPRSRAFIHHGGIGSCADGLRAHVPQLIIASAFDQFQNGYSIQRMGGGSWLRSRSTGAATARKAMCELLRMNKSESTMCSDKAMRADGRDHCTEAEAICDHLTADCQTATVTAPSEQENKMGP